MSECGQFRVCDPEPFDFDCYWCLEDINDEGLFPDVILSQDSTFDNASLADSSMPDCDIISADVTSACQRIIANVTPTVTYRPDPADGVSSISYLVPSIDVDDPSYTGAATRSSDVWDESLSYPKFDFAKVDNSSVLDYEYTYTIVGTEYTDYVSAYMVVYRIDLNCSGDRIRGYLYMRRNIRSTDAAKGSIDTQYFTDASFTPSGGGLPIRNDEGLVSAESGFGGVFDAADTCETDGLPTVDGDYALMVVNFDSGPLSPTEDVTPADVDNFKFKFGGI